MSDSNQVRDRIKSKKGAMFTFEVMEEELYRIVACTSVKRILRQMEKDGEIKCLGRMVLPGGEGAVKVFVEDKLVYEVETISRLNPEYKELKGLRKVFPELFTDPKIPGQYRFVNNGLGM